MHILEIRDNGGVSIDRYTITFSETEGRYHYMLGMSDLPTHPQGFCQHCTGIPGPHLGKLIEFEDLPEDCQRIIEQELED
jgi:hypothetical protein